jgi:predicted TIM-barrel fold metal-dependent hydrolase
MRIFDAHCHIEKTLQGYNLQAQHRNIIFNDVDLYKRLHVNVDAQDTKTLLFDFRRNLDFVTEQATKKAIQGFKVHSRIQKLNVSAYEELYDAFQTIEAEHLPVVFDAFYTGSELEYQPNLEKIVEFARLFPNNTVIIAHCGGYRVLEYLQHLKNVPNIVFELSFSLSYLQYSSVYRDFELLLRFADRNRIIFGTDFPYVDAQDQLKVFLKMADDLNISETDSDKILFGNACGLFGGLIV